MRFTAKGEATRQRIIAGTSAYLRVDTSGEITLDDIRAATHTSKSQLFHYFPGGKDELLLAVVRYEANEVIEDQQPYLGALDTPETWHQWRTVVIERYRKQGPSCPLSTLMNQIAGVPGAAAEIGRVLARWQNYLRRGIETMQRLGHADLSLDADLTAMTFLSAIQGAVVMLRATGSLAPIEAVYDHFFGVIFLNGWSRSGAAGGDGDAGRTPPEHLAAAAR